MDELEFSTFIRRNGEVWYYIFRLCLDWWNV